MTPEQLKEATFLLCSFQPFTYQPKRDTEGLLKFDQSQEGKPCSEGTYIEGEVMTENDIISGLRSSLCHQEAWVRHCQKLIASFFPDDPAKYHIYPVI